MIRLKIMGVIVAVGRQKAVLRHGEWRCADRALEKQLNQWTEEWLLSGNAPGLDEPDHEMAVAQEMAERLGGRILYRARTAPQRAVRDFFAKRQFRLAFPEPE